MLTFNAGPHEYRWKGEIVPGVTSVLEAAGLLDFGGASEEQLRAARERGTAVHKLCELADLNDLDEDSIDESLVGYLDAWGRFKVEQAFEIEVVEQPVYNTTHRYAGTLDRCGLLPRSYGLVLVDIKTGQPQQATGPQTAAYLAALPRTDRARTRIAVYLQPDGRYAMVTHDDRNDFNIFLAALTYTRCAATLTNWRAK